MKTFFLLIIIIIATLFPERVLAAATIHIVVRGDTLYSLSRRYGTTVDAIVQGNHLRGTTIYIGQKLTITSSGSPTGNTYIVIRGDTLYSIARRYETTVETIKRLNNLSSNLIYIGQHLVVPQNILPVATSMPLPTSIPTPIPTAIPNCHTSYPDFCIPPGLVGVDCGSAIIGGRHNFRVLQPDTYGLDGDSNGIGCQS